MSLSLPTTQGTIKTELDGKPTSFQSEPWDHLSTGREDGEIYIHLEDESERGWKQQNMDRSTVLAPSLGLPCSVKCIKDVVFRCVCVCYRVFLCECAC